MDPLDFTTDMFGGVTTVADALPADPIDFSARLSHSIAHWEDNGFRLAWLNVPAAKSALIPVAVEAGFSFHHAEAGYLMLTRRLREGAFVPSNASHFIGAGAVVINDARELLVVVERYHAKDRPNFFKMPGGLIDPGEHLADGVVREVFEETGVRAKFESVVCIRHQHGYRFGKSDFYFVCRLSPLSAEITLDPHEIAEARWMPVEEYLAGEHISLGQLHAPGVVLLGRMPPALRARHQARVQAARDLVEHALPPHRPPQPHGAHIGRDPPGGGCIGYALAV
jgi:8-oxo-dGTP pyrophosphatase MutT (NUDIX family)